MACFRRLHGRLPDSLVSCRGGFHESHELYGIHGIIHTIRQEAGGRDMQVAFAIVRRGTPARLRMDDCASMQSGACISGVFDFYMIAPTHAENRGRTTMATTAETWHGH